MAVQENEAMRLMAGYQRARRLAGLGAAEVAAGQRAKREVQAVRRSVELSIGPFMYWLGRKVLEGWSWLFGEEGVVWVEGQGGVGPQPAVKVPSRMRQGVPGIKAELEGMGVDATTRAYKAEMEGLRGTPEGRQLHEDMVEALVLWEREGHVAVKESAGIRRVLQAHADLVAESGGGGMARKVQQVGQVQQVRPRVRPGLPQVQWRSGARKGTAATEFGEVGARGEPIRIERAGGEVETIRVEVVHRHEWDSRTGEILTESETVAGGDMTRRGLRNEYGR